MQRTSSPLGVGRAELSEGAASVRKTFRRRSLVVHPDKVADALKTEAVAAFAKLEAASAAIDAMLQVDGSAAALLADVAVASDETNLVADAAAAARLLGCTVGCTEKVAKEAIRKKFHGPFCRIQDAARNEVAWALRVLEGAEEAVVRGTSLWTPAPGTEAVPVTRSVGCADLKAPATLLTSLMATEIVDVSSGCCGLALLTEGACAAADGSDPLASIAETMQRHEVRPKAAALRVALGGGARTVPSASRIHPSPSVVCAYFDAPQSSSTGGPAKRAKTAKPDRVRVSHILLRWKGPGCLEEDEFARPGFPAPSRSQAEAEKSLLELIEQLAAGDPKTLGTRFKAAVMKHSECSTALNVPYADLGWIEPGSGEASLEQAAFNAPVAGLSDLAVTSRGAHVMYRLA